MNTNDNRRIFEAGFDRAYALLSKLRAPVADSGAHAAIKAVPSTIWWHPDGYTVNNNFNGEDLILRSAALEALASAPVAGEAQEDLAPPRCPITGRPFFMALEHRELGMEPTYGGPYDSYTIPHLDGKPDQPWHERELRVYLYDHDLGGWRTDKVEVIPLRIVHEEILHGLEDDAPQASEAVRWMGIDLATNGMADVRNATLEQVAALLETAIPVSHFVFCDSPDGPINRVSNRSGQEVMVEAIAAIRALKTDPRAAQSAQQEQS